MAENKAIVNVDKQIAQQEALRLVRLLNDETSMPDVSQVTQDFIKRYVYAARKKIIEALVEHFKKEKGGVVPERLEYFLCAQDEDVRGRNLESLTRLMIQVALAAGNGLPGVILLYLLKTRNPKQVREYLFTEQCLGSLPQDNRLGPPLAEALLALRRDKSINPECLTRWLSALTPLVWAKGRSLIAEEDAGTILGVFQELRKEEFTSSLAMAVPAIVALADRTAAERFLASNTGKTFRELIPAYHENGQQTHVSCETRVTGDEKDQPQPLVAQPPLVRLGVSKTAEEKKEQVSSGKVTLALCDKEVVEALEKHLAARASEVQSLTSRLEQYQDKLKRAEKETEDCFVERNRLQKTLYDSRETWNSERMVLMEKNNRLRADIAALEVERDGLSTNIEDLRQEIVQARRQYDAELDNHQHQWTGTLLERVRPHALEVRDHIVKLREERPEDEAIRFLAISYYNAHRELARLMELDVDSECIPRRFMNAQGTE